HGYDKLILAMGSRAFVPKDVPLHLPGVFTMRNRQNADGLKARLHRDAHVLIVGGGLLGLELSASLREAGIAISIVQLSGRLMERQLDTLAGNMLLDFIEEKRIRVYTHDQVQSIVPEGDRLLTASLKSGRELSCDAIVFAIGTRPNIELGAECGLECGRGIIVNDYLQTSDPDILAMGELAEHRGKLNGITAAAEQQADTAARFLNGDLLSGYEGSLPMNILKFSDLDLCSLGIPEIPANAEGYEEILFIDKSQRYYKKCIIKDDRLVGAILMGDKSEFAEFRSLIESKLELSEKRKALLRSGKAAEPVLGRLVCSCNNVGTGNLEKLISLGCEDLGELCRLSGAGLGCGSCKPEVKEILDNSVASGVLN
ncbi:MAG TPA: FAD-dependent oxidoreductase, partial [Anseongella sp.]|nr:FAD-dependent oxidoreductase [Anseongella sp.]